MQNDKMLATCLGVALVLLLSVFAIGYQNYSNLSDSHSALQKEVCYLFNSTVGPFSNGVIDYGMQWVEQIDNLHVAYTPLPHSVEMAKAYESCYVDYPELKDNKEYKFSLVPSRSDEGLI